MVDLNEGSGGFLRQAALNYLPTRDDAVVPPSIARDYALRDGTEIEGLARDGGGGRRTLVEIHKASGLTPEEYRALLNAATLTSSLSRPGLALGTMVQFVPFQRSTRVWEWLLILLWV